MERTMRRRHPDEAIFDTIIFQTVPRFKTSDLSGDEWRIRIKVGFFYKGHLVFEKGYTQYKYAVAELPYLFLNMGQEKDFKHIPTEEREKLCDQPGCSDEAVSTYKLKEIYTKFGDGPLESTWNETRAFCHRHLQRGDCGRDDADHNYVVLDGPGPDGSTMLATDESPNVFGGTITMDQLGDFLKSPKDFIKVNEHKLTPDEKILSKALMESIDDQESHPEDCEKILCDGCDFYLLRKTLGAPGYTEEDPKKQYSGCEKVLDERNDYTIVAGAVGFHPQPKWCPVLNYRGAPDKIDPYSKKDLLATIQMKEDKHIVPPSPGSLLLLEDLKGRIDNSFVEVIQKNAFKGYYNKNNRFFITMAHHALKTHLECIGFMDLVEKLFSGRYD